MRTWNHMLLAANARARETRVIGRATNATSAFLTTSARSRYAREVSERPSPPRTVEKRASITAAEHQPGEAVVEHGSFVEPCGDTPPNERDVDLPLSDRSAAGDEANRVTRIEPSRTGSSRAGVECVASVRDRELAARDRIGSDPSWGQSPAIHATPSDRSPLSVVEARASNSRSSHASPTSLGGRAGARTAPYR